MRSEFYAIALLCSLPIAGRAARPNYGIDDAVALARKQNLEIAIARKQIRAANGGLAFWLACDGCAQKHGSV